MDQTVISNLTVFQKNYKVVDKNKKYSQLK